MFPLEGLPTTLAIIASLNPLSYAVDAFRTLLIDAGHYGMAVDLSVLGAMTLVFLVVGGHFFGRLQA